MSRAFLNRHRLLLRYFSHARGPHAGALDSLPPGLAAEDCALAALRGQQAAPELLRCGQWRGAAWFELLSHGSSIVRWCAVQAVAAMLRLSDAGAAALSARALTEQETVHAALRCGLMALPFYIS